MLRGLTGTPMRNRLRANSSFADAEPEPLTLANLTTKSLTASIRGAVPALTLVITLVVMSGRHLRLASASAAGPRLREHELLHVPCARGAALGAQAAVQADVLVLDHDAARLQLVGDVDVLVGVPGRRMQARPQVGLVAVDGEGDAVGGADVDAGIALDALARRED